MFQIYSHQIQVLTLADVDIEKWPGLTWCTAPAALIIEQPEFGRAIEWDAVWGLPEVMSVDDAWSDFDHADEYEILD